ncbi:MAG: hypothetical protein KI790_09040 [Cyclobacteriaceae bacterium]|nr:hypothetical protein [Cyclobacteriaceae bacterium HetDA_MAG_MS6]
MKWELIAKYLAGEDLTPDETQALQEILEQKEELKKMEEIISLAERFDAESAFLVNFRSKINR